MHKIRLFCEGYVDGTRMALGLSLTTVGLALLVGRKRMRQLMEVICGEES